MYVIVREPCKQRTACMYSFLILTKLRVNNKYGKNSWEKMIDDIRYTILSRKISILWRCTYCSHCTYQGRRTQEQGNRVGGGIAPSQELRCITTNFMGCLPLAVTTHFCLPTGFKRSLDGTDQSTVWKWLGRHLMVLCTNEIAPSYVVVQLNLAGTLILFKSGGDILCPTYYNALFPQISRPSYGHVLCILCTKSFAQINETILHCTSYIPSHTLKVR